MVKRKPATASKRARSPKIAVRAQRNKQVIVRSAKDNLLRSVAAAPIESPLKLHDDPKLRDDSKQREPIVENGLTASENAAAVQDGCSRMVRDNNPKKGFDFPLGTALAYQAKILEIARANMQFTFEFSQRLGTIKSPFEFFDVIAEFTRRRIDMFRKYEEELAAYPFC